MSAPLAKEDLLYILPLDILKILSDRYFTLTLRLYLDIRLSRLESGPLAYTSRSGD